MTDEIQLDVIDTVEELNNSISENLVYPCLLIEGVESQEEVLFIIKHNKGINKLPLFINVNNFIKKIGNFVLSLDNLLILHSIGDYSLQLFKSSDDVVTLDLSDPKCMEKFCSII